MTTLLTKAFEKVSKLSESEQDQIAQQIIEDLEGESKWDASLTSSLDKLSIVADKALDESEKGNAHKAGFDDL